MQLPLPRIHALRRVLWLVVALALALGHFGLGVEVAWGLVMLTMLCWALLEPAARVLDARADVRDAFALALLALDALAVAAVVYLTGGYTNPLISLLLVLVALGATFLSPMLTGALAAWTTLLYSALAFFYQPLVLRADAQAGAVSLHLAGMWLTFLLSAALLAAFVARLSAHLRRREAELAALREQALRREQVLSLGLLAAGAAHELGTPLSTMAVIAEELEDALEGQPALRADATTLRQQVAHCRDVLTRTLRQAGHARPRAEAQLALEPTLRELAGRWQLLRPSAPLRLHLVCTDERPVWLALTLRQALLNLLDNASDAARSEVVLSCHCDASGVVVGVTDDGAVAPVPPGTSTKPHGLGIGLLLANTSIVQLGGSLRLTSRAQGGTLAQVQLPWAALAPPPAPSNELDTAD
jgi:two-component system sensor histidine kinase RegB